jgi:putative two-component system response regulator
MNLPAAQAAETEALSTAAALTTLNAMARGELGFELTVVERIEELFRALPDEHASVNLVEGLLNVQQLLDQQDLFRLAVPAGLKAVRWSRRLGDKRLLIKALIFRAILAAHNYELSVAVEGLLDALQLGKETDDAYYIAVCYCDLAEIMLRLGRNRAAVKCLEAGLEWCIDLDAENKNILAIKAATMVTMSDLCLRQGDYREALAAARAAQDFFGQIDDVLTAPLRACAVVNEVEAHFRLQDLEAGAVAIEYLSQLSKRHPSVAVEGYLQQAMAIHDAFTGNAERAVQDLRRLAQKSTLRDGALRLLIDIYERTGEPGKALEVTRNVLENLRSARREVTKADLSQIDMSSLEGDDSYLRELIAQSARFEVEASRVSDRFQAKLAYLFELGVSAELREEDEAHAGEHIYRVGRLCALLAVEADCAEEMCWLAEVAGRAHDVGKTSLPLHTVLKTDALTRGERELLQAHAEDGAALVAQLAEPRLVRVVAAVRHHHENWDGSGYPNRLSGEQIPLLARIVAICDSFDAMTHSRPFRSARSVASGIREVERCAGSQFDPRLAGLFVNLVGRLLREHGDLDEYLGESGRRTRWAKSHPELMRVLEGQPTDKAN